MAKPRRLAMWWPIRKTLHLVEALVFLIWLLVCRLLPVDWASAMGGSIGRTLGPLSRNQRIAEGNLRRAMPELSDVAVQSTLLAMWDNLGRVAAEYAHLDRLMRDRRRVVVEDPDGLLNQVIAAHGGVLMLTAHYGNWELGTAASVRAGVPQSVMYRAANNRLVDRIVARLRRASVKGEMIPKGPGAMRRVINLLRDGSIVGMVVDQKNSSGIPVEFFGRDAMTTAAPAALFRRFGVPILLRRVVRTKGAHFVLHITRLSTAGVVEGRSADHEITRRINAELEAWIRERPDLWFWVHRRWPRDG